MRNILVAFVLMAMAVGSVSAKIDITKVNPRLRTAMESLFTMPNNMATVKLCDSLYAEADRLGDEQVKLVVAQKQQVTVFMGNDEALMDKYTERCLSAAKKLNNANAYYAAYRNQGNMFIRLRDFPRAFDVIKNAEADAKTLFGGRRGNWEANYLKGVAYYNLTEYDKSAESYRKAIEYRKKEDPDRYEPELYSRWARCYIVINEIDSSLIVAEQGLAFLGDGAPQKLRDELLGSKCFALYGLKRNAEADVIYADLTNRNVNYETRKYNEIFHYRYVKDYPNAIAATNRNFNEAWVRYKWLAEIAEEQGDFKLACQYQDSAIVHRVMMQNEEQSKQFDNYNKAFELDRLKNTNLRLALQNSDLELRQAAMELDKQQSLVELDRIDAQNANLALRNNQLSIDQEREISERQQMESQLRARKYETTVRKSREQERLMWLVVCFALLGLLSGLILLYARKRSMRMLQEKNGELEVALEKAKESEKQKMRFLQNMSHEIRTPLNAIVGFTQVLAHQEEGDFTKEQQEEFVALVDQNTENLTTLINDILDISEMENGESGYKITIGKCSVHDICHKALASVKMRCPDGVKLYYTTDIAGDLTLVTDAKRVQQVLINFLTNAEKHTLDGEIRLHSSLGEEPGKLVLSVADTGEGVPADKAEEIFERFAKLDTFAQGTGLGLNICRQIAAKLSGEVRLDTHYDRQGARFVFILPLSSAESEKKI